MISNDEMNNKNSLKNVYLIFDCCKRAKCACNEIYIIRRFVIMYLKKIKMLEVFTYNKYLMNYKSIDAFELSIKHNNDINNKTRENIIGAIINQKVPEKYFTISHRWKRLRDSIIIYLKNLVENEQNKENDNDNFQPITITSVKLEHCGGRKFNYDFKIVMNQSIIFNIELKYNADTIEEAPQFVSPMKPSQYMSSSYEEYFYDNYLPQLSELSGLPIPDRKQYMKEIHNNVPLCMKEYQELYYKGCKQSSKYTGNEKHIEFYEKAKEIDNESRRSFIENNDLNIELLSSYLQDTQNGKIYMLYKNNSFKMKKVNMEDYQILSYEKVPNKYMFIATSFSGKKIKILLRWKNGNGIAYPAFQIS